MDDEERSRTLQTIRERLGQRRTDMIFSIRYGFKLGMSAEQICTITKIDPWFINQIEQIVRREEELRSVALAA
jgi:carbamoyl-phosphate synthase large subunit